MFLLAVVAAAVALSAWAGHRARDRADRGLDILPPTLVAVGAWCALWVALAELALPGSPGLVAAAPVSVAYDVGFLLIDAISWSARWWGGSNGGVQGRRRPSGRR